MWLAGCSAASGGDPASVVTGGGGVSRWVPTSFRGADQAAICPSGSGWGWTRKRSGAPIRGTIQTPGGRWDLDGHGVDDESAGYQRRHTSWHWSAGVGRATDGRPLAWNLVEGINDPPANSERAIWVFSRFARRSRAV